MVDVRPGHGRRRWPDARLLDGRILVAALPLVGFVSLLAGFQVAIPIGLLVSAGFAGASAFVDIRLEVGAELIRRRTLLRIGVLVVMGGWFIWSADLREWSQPYCVVLGSTHSL